MLPSPIHVVCNAPLLAPVPLPYHSPTFLHFDLPDIDQDLSRPPYVRQSPKRKRDPQDHLDTPPPKRHSAAVPPPPRLHPRHHRRHPNLQCHASLQFLTPRFVPQSD
ncbi:hypothetical protein AGABI2DRAFT_115272 [Agaricus bisporus var. bisporus H97]|uniref:hypothetical protein n=1 Tax=Agaricus bisporus var. bisporus (strain H97 / ATCC MYA-4626 / FGSC 10389) TaxID=936046 RepID=UPI00029F6056|nr:hypothetical protein AGABI2DRAFT_115272 [Agaricus bisporus var. bisporus H97]EKV50215.1 hypothetical protein AGABI2DRAFT_115272 [Agaricus bisporus var. bisporus H97]